MKGVFKNRDFRLYLVGQACSTFGDSAMYLALAIWAKQLTGSSSAAGAVFFAFMAPMTLSAPFLDPNLSCSYSYWKAGQYQTFSGYEGVRQGNIHFAGEHCSQDFQGYMEGGAREGARAALEVYHALTGK